MEQSQQQKIKSIVDMHLSIEEHEYMREEVETLLAHSTLAQAFKRAEEWLTLRKYYGHRSLVWGEIVHDLKQALEQHNGLVEK